MQIKSKDLKVGNRIVLPAGWPDPSHPETRITVDEIYDDTDTVVGDVPEEDGNYEGYTEFTLSALPELVETW